MLTVVLAHYGGIDETAIIWVPVIMVGGLLWLFRKGDPTEDEPPPGGGSEPGEETTTR